MTIEGVPLPKVLDDDATIIDVWRIDENIGITLSRSSGRIMAGTQISYEGWVELNAYVMNQFGKQEQQS